MIPDAIGLPTRRVGGPERVSGRQQYVGDVKLDGVLHVKLVTLDVAHARILTVRAEKARQVEGVHAVVSAADLPSPMPRFGPTFSDRPVLADGEVKYHGEPVAAVVAETEAAAEAAAELVEVDIEELPAVLTVDDALNPDLPLVQDPELRGASRWAGSNVLREWDFGWGDVDSVHLPSAQDGGEIGCPTAALVVEHTYTFPMVTHFAIEPHTFLAAPRDDGLVVWSAVQHPTALQDVLARLVGLPMAKVRIIAPDPGGAFGGKQHAKYEPLLALLALRLNRPVRLALTLEQTFQAVRRTNFRVRARTGFRRDGTLVFQDLDISGLLGAYADIASRVVEKASHLACGPYKVPHARVAVRSLLSHTPPATAFRGFGTPQVAWAIESQMDEAARTLGIDAVDLRLRNLAGRGEEIFRDDKPADGDWPESVRKAAEWIGWGRPLAPGRGRGLTVAVKASATTGASYSVARLLFDGSLVVMAGTSDMGQGARTVLTQIAAQEMGIPIGWITVVMGDTDVVPFDLQTSASRSTVFMGTAVMQACRDVKRQLRAMIAERYDLADTDVEITDGTVRTPDREMSYAQALEIVYAGVRGEVIGVGSRRGERSAAHPLGGSPAFYEFNCTAVEVEVDRETGELQILRHVSVGDVGKALNTSAVEGQDEGAAIMGLGHTLMEHVLMDDRGRIRNLGALDYRIPTTKDVPLELHSMVVENADGPGPFGAKGAGEGGLLGVAPAVAAAVTQAVGVVIRDLPLTAERIWQAIVEADGAAPAT